MMMTGAISRRREALRRMVESDCQQIYDWGGAPGATPHFCCHFRL